MMYPSSIPAVTSLQWSVPEGRETLAGGESAQQGNPRNPSLRIRSAPEGAQEGSAAGNLPGFSHIGRFFRPSGAARSLVGQSGGCARSSLHHRLISPAPPGLAVIDDHPFRF